MNVDDACRYLNNRLGVRLMFEGQVIYNLSHRHSACRQLHDLWLKKTGRQKSYEDFKKMLRFRMSKGWVVANVSYDPVPVIAAAAGLTALAAGGVAYAKLRRGSPVNVSPSISANTPKLDPHRINSSSDRPPDTDGSSRMDAPKLDPHVSFDPIENRPAVFVNVGNSCYFHASMLMLYQMRKWYFARDCNDNALLSELGQLLHQMGIKDCIRGPEVRKYYLNIQRAMFPADVNRQQDANEFFLTLFRIMSSDANCNLTPVSFKTIIDTCEPVDSDAMKINSLIFEAKPIDSDEVRDFERRWIEFQPEQRNFTQWTVIDGKIVKRTQGDSKKPGYQPQIQSGDANPFGSLDFETLPQTRRREELTFQILNLVLPNDRSDVCKLVELAMLEGQTKIGQVKLDPKLDLFNYKTKSFETYENVDEYLMVLMAYDPKSVGSRRFEYLDTIEIGLYTYRLTCVIYRIGCGANAGHYTAALFVGSTWVHYDDLSQSRTDVANLGVLRGVPFMLLFHRQETK